MTTNCCLICLRLSPDSIEIFSEIGKSKNIAEILSKHFWFKSIETNEVSPLVCVECWTKTYAFHEFYQSVEILHKEYFSEGSPIDDNDHQSHSPTHTEAEGCEIESTENIAFADCKLAPIFMDDNVDALSEDVKSSIERIKCEVDVDSVFDADTFVEPSAIAESIPSFVNMSCDRCDAIFMSLAAVRMHYETDHASIDGDVKCCGRRFKGERDFMDHIQKEHWRFAISFGNEKFVVCHLCKLIFNSSSGLSSHLRKIHNHIPEAERSVCEVCLTECSSKAELKAHIKTNHETKTKTKETSQESRVQCSVCGNWQKNQTLLGVHMRRSHNSLPLKCPHCDTVRANRNTLNGHILAAHSEPTHRCNMCEKSFRTTIALKEHMATHTGVGLFTCPFCPLTFFTSSMMHKHKKRKHPEKWSIKCDKCGKRFARQHSLNEHLRKKHCQRKTVLSENEEFICEYCAKVFNKKPAFRAHMTTHITQDTPKIRKEQPRVQCNLCGTWQRNQSALKVHHRVTHNPDRLKCPNCDKTLGSKESLKKHIAEIHSEPCHQCVICDKTFTRATTLEDHMASHTGERKYGCPFCNKAFKSYSNLYKHKTRMHREEFDAERKRRRQNEQELQ